MNDPRRLREMRDELSPEALELLAAMECPPPPPGAKDRVAMAVLDALSEDAPAQVPATVRRIG